MKMIALYMMLFVAARASASPLAADSMIATFTQSKQGFSLVAGKHWYFKIFDSALTNAGKENMDLSSLCFEAFDSEGNVYQLDTIDERLITGQLKSMDTIGGLMSFSSESESVYQANLIRIYEGCNG